MSDDPEPVPENDPRHIDPAGNLADAVESGDLYDDADLVEYHAAADTYRWTRGVEP